MPTSDPRRVDYALIGENGVIVRMGTCSVESLHLQVGPGLMVAQPVEGVSDETHYWNGFEFMPYPDKPGTWAVWDGTAWIDPRTAQDIEDQRTAALEAMRASASMTRSDLLIAAVGAGIIPASEAGIAARGEVPPSMEPVFSSLTPEMQVEAVIRWAASTMIDRTNPILEALAASLGMGDAELDALFGIVLPPENQ